MQLVLKTSVKIDKIGNNMAHYAFLNDNNIVTEVIVGKDEDDNADLPEGFDSWEAWYADFRGQTCKRTSTTLLAILIL